MKLHNSYIFPILISLLILIGAGFSFIGCNKTNKEVTTEVVDSVVNRVDTILVLDSTWYYQLVTLQSDYYAIERKLKSKTDSIEWDCWIAGRRCIKINYYISICEKNPSQVQFFYGWIRRTMTEDLSK